jgi:acyl-coenzyme A thioesterase PaaI-like protein
VNVIAIPFNRFLGLRANGPTITLPANADYENHLGTVHAGAQFALAEAASGQWMLDHFPAEAAGVLAVVRHADVKFRKPATGELAAHADVPQDNAEQFLDTLTRRGRATITVSIRLLDSSGSVTLEGSFEWFVQRRLNARL